MTERQQAILSAIIEQYAEIAAPVGSVTLAKLFGVSSATIRSEMAKLEEMGFVKAPPVLGVSPPARATASTSTVSLTLR